MRIEVPQHHFSIDASDEWVPDEMDSEATHGLYLRSVAFGLYMNVRAQHAGHPLTDQGLRALLGEQGWASPRFDEWAEHVGALTLVGATFETEGMNGEVVLEVFVTDGRRLVNLAGPAPREVIVAATPAVRRLATTLKLS